MIPPVILFQFYLEVYHGHTVRTSVLQHAAPSHSLSRLLSLPLPPPPPPLLSITLTVLSASLFPLCASHSFSPALLAISVFSVLLAFSVPPTPSFSIFSVLLSFSVPVSFCASVSHCLSLTPLSFSYIFFLALLFCFCLSHFLCPLPSPSLILYAFSLSRRLFSFSASLFLCLSLCLPPFSLSHSL